jgi:hypothetical protein
LIVAAVQSAQNQPVAVYVGLHASYACDRPVQIDQRLPLHGH